MKHIIHATIIALAGMLAACTHTDEKPTLMVSILPQKYVLDKIADGKFAVECMLEKGESPETFDPTMSQMARLATCKAYFLIGNMSFEEKIEAYAGETSNKMAVVNSTEGIAPIYNRHGGNDAAIDPHVWMSVANMRKMARNMANAMASIDNANKTLYEKNFQKLDAELAAFQDSLSAQLRGHRGKAFVVWHPALSYFARDYGLEQISVEYEGKEAPVRFVENQLSHAKERGATIFFRQIGGDSRQAATVSAQLNIKSVDINPLSYEWKSEMQRIADGIAQ